MITIDKGVQVSKRMSGGRKDKYPWRGMSIGDSFFIAGAEGPIISSLAARQKARIGCTFVTRTVTENGVKGVRVWRIA